MKTLNMETKGTMTAWVIGWFSAIISHFSNLSLSEWSAVVAIVSTLIGLFLTWYYQRRKDKREKLETEAKIKYYEHHEKDSNRHDL